MKKVVLVTLLAFAGAVLTVSPCVAQLGTSDGQVHMSADEYAKYNKAVEDKDPAAKATDFEAYLKAYPNSAVKADALQQMMFSYSQTNNSAQTLDAADRLLQLEPDNLRALVFEVYLRRSAADANTDPAAKAAALDVVAGYAEKGLHAAQPKGMSAADFKTLTDQAYPTFESAIADDDIAKKDYAGAVKMLKTEIDSVPVPDTEKPSTTLQDIYVLAQAYYNSTPHDYLNCAWYATRAAAFAPDAYKPQIQPLATYCYNTYHGGPDGYAAMQTAVQTNLNPPAGFTVVPAPKPEDIISKLFADTPDLTTLAISDREFVIEYGKPADADKVFGAVSGKSVELPGVTVVSATPTVVTVSVSPGAVQDKKADFTFNMKEPIKDKDIPAVGALVTLDGTYASYTQNPLMITMSDASLVLPKPKVVHHPVRRKH